ncbi:hypothetical protein DSO57_1035629, partial [Entomophthora muscae]
DNNNLKQQKGTKQPSKAPKTPKKKTAPTKKTASNPSPELSSEQSPAHFNRGEESDGSLSIHSVVTVLF